MGEAARRQAAIAELKAKNAIWLGSLSPEEGLIAEVAKATYDKVVGGLGMTEGCYNLAFFLHEHLHRKHGIQVKIVVGWVNDGLWDGATSHAWVEYKGKKIDIALHKTSHPDAQPSGDLIILDYIVKPGKVAYTYWLTLPEGAARKLELMRRSSPEWEAIIKHKEIEHQRMLELSLMPGGAEEYLRHAPATNNYEFLARVVSN